MSILFALLSFSISFCLVKGQYQELDDNIKNVLEIYTNISWIVMISIIGIFLLTVFIAFCYHKRLIGSDKPEWISISLYFISIFDYITDLLFFGELSISQHTLTSYAALFLFIPHILSVIICIIYVLRWNYCPKRHELNTEYTSSHGKLLIFLSLFGNFYGTIELVNSKMFHLSSLNMQISSRNRNQCSIIHIISDVLIGSFPMMIISMAYMSLNEYQNISLAAIAMISSFICIAIGIFIIVSKLCNNLVEILIPTPYINDNDDKAEIMYRSFIFKSSDLDEHHLYSHKLIASAISLVLQISDYQVLTTFIGALSGAIECHIEITPEMNDKENLVLFLNLLEAPSSGLYDVLKQGISSSLCLNESALQITVERVGFNNDNDNHNIGSGPVEWACSQCTFVNHFVIDQCEICGSPRYGGGTNQTNTEQLAIDLSVDDDDDDIAAVDEELEMAKQRSLQEIEKNKKENDINININNDDDIHLNDDEFLKFISDGDIHHNQDLFKPIHDDNENKDLFKAIEDDNQQIDAKDGGLWTGDLCDDEDDEIDDIPNIIHKEDDIEIEAEMKESHISDNLLASNDINNMFNYNKEEKQEHKSNVSQHFMEHNTVNNVIRRESKQSQHSNQISTGFEISEIDENEHDIIAPTWAPPQKDIAILHENQNDDDDDLKDDLFDNRYTNDGLNDDFDDLRQPDVFG